MRCAQVHEAVQLIRGEFAEVPDLQITFWQARCLWDLPEDLCDAALTALTRSGFLVRTVEGVYTRRLPPTRPWHLRPVYVQRRAG
jgi:hypothetical protein